MKRMMLVLGIALAALAVVVAGTVPAAEKGRSHTIYGSLIEIKGGTTTDKLGPPGPNPEDLSKGYVFKGPGHDNTRPHRWEVASYLFVPAYVTIQQGDEVVLTAFVVNGDQHEVWITAPDGRKVVENQMWRRGREYTVRFVTEQTGAYRLVCSDHAPSMVATFLAQPRPS
jgi:plastocyanin